MLSIAQSLGQGAAGGLNRDTGRALMSLAKSNEIQNLTKELYEFPIEKLQKMVADDSSIPTPMYWKPLRIKATLSEESDRVLYINNISLQDEVNEELERQQQEEEEDEDEDEDDDNNSVNSNNSGNLSDEDEATNRRKKKANNNNNNKKPKKKAKKKKKIVNDKHEEMDVCTKALSQLIHIDDKIRIGTRVNDLYEGVVEGFTDGVCPRSCHECRASTHTSITDLTRSSASSKSASAAVMGVGNGINTKARVGIITMKEPFLFTSYVTNKNKQQKKKPTVQGHLFVHAVSKSKKICK